MIDLLDCPFCGGRAEYFQSGSSSSGHGESSDNAGIKCTTCFNGFSSCDYADNRVEERKAEAKKSWNARVAKKGDTA